MEEPSPVSEQRSRNMSAIRSRDTAPELAVRSILHARGMRYRTNFRPVAGVRRTADIVFTRRRIAVFIDGCYWHGCADHFVMPKSNLEYWVPKIEGNQRRDAQTTAMLTAAGWTVLRFWAHEPAGNVADAIEAAVTAAVFGAPPLVSEGSG
ncbi:very short patch repair endonuclease [Microbacterium sp. BWT-B31]|uniref:very short patch repair endonuclease n=1 Tax=Microbacterium sp. BWT-B31 TaxID=3232072 RepID=UPI0035274E84